jgi:signal transduction histidine kinase
MGGRATGERLHRLDADPVGARQLLREALGHAQESLQELRELAAGMHPSILTNRGLSAAVDALAQRSPLPVDLHGPERRYPSSVEAAAYFVIAEGLTNTAKHASASRSRVSFAEHDDMLTVSIEDDGCGGAHLGSGGLPGIKDRVEALGGGFHLDSPPGRGTRLWITLPLVLGIP